MTGFRRLLDDDASELELELLRAAQEDAPPPASLLKAAAALGIGAVATGAVGLGSSTALAAAAEAAGSTSIAAANAAVIGGTQAAALGAGANGALGGFSLSLAMFAKPLAVGLVAGLAASAGVHYTSQRDAAPAAAQRMAPNPQPLAAPTQVEWERAARNAGTATEPPVAADAAALETPVDVAARAPAKTPVHAAERRFARQAAVTHGVPSVTPSAAAEQAPTAAFAVEEPPKVEPAAKKQVEPARSLAPEVALLDRVRSALVANDARGAVRLLDTYQSAPRSGVFEPEASVLRIQALLKLGNRAGAARLARAFVQAHPGNRHAQSLRALAAEAER